MGILPGLVSCLLIHVGSDRKDLIIRVLNSLSFGSTNILGAIIIGEYTSPKYRGIFLNLLTTVMYLGLLGRHILNSYFLYTTIVNVSFMLQCISLVIVSTWPRSPYWLAMQGCREECEASFAWLRGTSKHSEQEKHDLLKSDRIICKEVTLMENLFSFCKTCASRNFTKPVTIVVFGAILAETSGRHYLPILAADFFAKVQNDRLSQKLDTSILIVGSSLMSLALLALFRHRKILLATGFSSIMAMLFGSFCVFLLSYKVVSFNSSWIGVLFITMHIVCSNLGSTSIPISLVGELFPLENKAVGSFVSGVVTLVASGSTVRLAGCFLANINLYGTLAILGMCMTISLLILFFIVPETKGRSLQEIEQYFNYGWFAEDSYDDDEKPLRAEDFVKYKF